MRRRRTGRAAAALVAAAVAVVAAAVAGCGGDGGDEERSQPSLTVPSTSATTATTAPPEPDPDPERVEAEAPPGEPRPDIDVNVTYPSDFTPDQIAVVEAYRGYWHAAYLMNDPCGPTEPGERAECPADPDHPLIRDFADGQPLESVRSNASQNNEDARVVVIPTGGAYAHEVVDVRVNGSSAVLIACAVDDAVVQSVAGDVIDDSVITARYQTSLSRVSTGWIVTSDIETVSQWAGERAEQCRSDP